MRGLQVARIASGVRDGRSKCDFSDGTMRVPTHAQEFALAP